MGDRGFNRLVRLRNQVRTAWADVDVQLTRRHDLLPSLVAAVRAYAGHEAAVLQAAVTEPKIHAGGRRRRRPLKRLRLPYYHRFERPLAAAVGAGIGSRLLINVRRSTFINVPLPARSSDAGAFLVNAALSR